MCQCGGTHQIVMSFSPPVIGFCLKSPPKGGGGHRHPRTPLATPLKVFGILFLRAEVAHLQLKLLVY